MSEMDEYISKFEDIKCKIACAITGIPAYDHIKTRVFQGRNHLDRTSLQSFGELESDPVYPPVF
jgi:hypothetical protein